MTGFVNRERELAALSEWWERPGAQLGVVWGRRRVGKSRLITHWSQGRRTVFHVARNRPLSAELRALSEAAARVVSGGRRDLRQRPFTDWDDTFDFLANAAEQEPLLVVLDEFPELVLNDPSAPSALRAIWERIRDTKLRLLLCGSAVRLMEQLLEERAPLYGRATLRLHLRPFAPHEAALMLPRLSPAERAKVWGVCGGIPSYLALWDQNRTFSDNLERLVCSTEGLLRAEGELVLSTEDFPGGRRERTAEHTLRAIASGRTRFSEIADEIGTQPTRALQALQETRLVDRVQPVGTKPDNRRAFYRIADNFLAFWLTVVERHQPAIQQGLGAGILPVMEEGFADYMGDRWEEAFRAHLRRILATDERVAPLVELGRFWKQRTNPGEDPCELDALGLSGRSRQVSVAGEAKWARKVNGGRLVYGLERKLRMCGHETRSTVLLAVAARDEVAPGPGGLSSEHGPVLPVTADAVFG